MLSLLPQAAIVEVGDLDRGVCYAGPLVARQLERQYRAVWQFAHWFDRHVANPFVPALNLGFDTMQAQPQASSGVGNITCDGYVDRGPVDETFTTIRAGAGSTFSTTTTDVYVYTATSGTTNQFANLRRDFLTYDTSWISTRTIVQATFSVYGDNKRNAIGTPVLHVVQSTQAVANDISTSDFQQFGTTSFGNMTYANYVSTDTAYNDIPLNASGRAAIVGTGITKLCTITDWDLNNSFTGTWVINNDSYFTYWTSDNTSGTAKAPKLTITYGSERQHRRDRRKSRT